MIGCDFISAGLLSLHVHHRYKIFLPPIVCLFVAPSASENSCWWCRVVHCCCRYGREEGEVGRERGSGGRRRRRRRCGGSGDDDVVGRCDQLHDVVRHVTGRWCRVQHQRCLHLRLRRSVCLFNIVHLIDLQPVGLQGGPKKRGHKLMAIILSNLDGYEKFTGRFLGRFAINWLLKIPPLIAYVATLLCETLMSENKRLTINYEVM